MAEARYDASGQPVTCGCCLLPMTRDLDDADWPPGLVAKVECRCTDACADADTCTVVASDA